MLLLPLSFAAEPAPTDWVADSARYHVRIVTDAALDVSGEYQFTAISGDPAERILVGANLLVLDTSGNTLATSNGLMFQVASRARFRGLLSPSTAGEAELTVLPAARQHVEIDAPGLDVTVDGAVDGWLTNADHLILHWAPHVDASTETPAPLVLAEVGTAAWAAEGGLESRTAVRWRVRRGEVSSFSVDVGSLTDVEVTGGNIARWGKSGSTVTIETLSAVRGGFSASISGRSPLVSGESDLPCPRPLDVMRVDKWWTLARSDEGELIPVSSPESVTSRMVPAWARGLAESAPLAYWHGDAPVRVLSAHYDPVAGPDTVIERAEFVAASNEDGRTLLRATLRVRNERKQYLHVKPSPGFRLLATRVSGTPVTVLSDGENGFYVPMEKSIETVRGLLTFPIELTWIGEGGAWEKKGTKTVSLPSVDAPIQAAQWELHLPRGVVAIGATAAHPKLAEPKREAAAEAMNNAMAAYKKNDFSGSQEWLNHAKESAPEDEDVQRLQSNLDVLLKAPAASVSNEDVATRRVRELAHAKTSSMSSYQSRIEAQAKDALRQGDYDKAEGYLQEIETLATELDRTAQLEDAEQKNKIADVRKTLENVRNEKKAKKKAEESEQQAESDADGVADAYDGHRDDGNGDDSTIDFKEQATFGNGSDTGISGDAVGWSEEGIEGGVVGGILSGVAGGVVSGSVGGSLAGQTADSGAFEFSGENLMNLGYASGESGAANGWGNAVDTPSPQPVTTADPVEAPPPELERIPASRDYSDSVQTLAGESKPTFRLPNLIPPRAAAPAAPTTAAPPAKPTAGPMGTKSPPPPPPAPPRQAANPVAQTVSSTVAFGGLGVRGSGSGGGGTGRGIAAGKGEVGRGPPKMAGRAKVPEMDGEAMIVGEKSGKTDAAKGTPAGRDQTTRAPLQAHATPMTVAMPMGGAAVEHTAALLEADTFPTFTLRYRTQTGVY